MVITAAFHIGTYIRSLVKQFGATFDVHIIVRFFCVLAEKEMCKK